MSETYCGLSLDCLHHLGGFPDKLWRETSALTEDNLLSLPPTLREDILVTEDLVQILCFIENDDLLQEPYAVHCFHPQNTSLLHHLLTDYPDKRFLATIDNTYRLHIPIATLKRIGITKEVLFMKTQPFSWSIVGTTEEEGGFQVFFEALADGTISIPEDVPDYDEDR